MKNTGRFLFKIFKMLIIIISIAYIVYKLYNEQLNGATFDYFKRFNLNDIFVIAFVLLLSLLNWTTESFKFKFLIKSFQYLKLTMALKAVLAGITVSIFTPRRVGEFGGRIFVLDTKNRVSGIFATLLGNLSQLLVTLLVGIIFLPLYLSHNKDIMLGGNNLSYFIVSLVVVIAMLLIVYFNVSKAGKLFIKVRFLNKYVDFIEFIKQYRIIDLIEYLALSLTRYVVFTFQFFILLKLFGIEISYIEAIIGVSQMYLIMAILPTFALAELGVRGSVAVWIFSSISNSASGIIAASVSLWIINLALPALFGTWFLSKMKY